MDDIADHFWDAYERLSMDGHCDSPGGMEYIRVHLEWEEAGKPEDVERFILERANAGPDVDY